MKKVISSCICLLIVLSIKASSLSWSGNAEKVIAINPELSTGLNEVCVLRSLSGVTVSYSSETPSAVRWYRFSNLGGGYAEEIKDISTSQGISTLNHPEGDMGYIVEEGDTRYYFWIVDYSRHEFRAQSLTLGSQDCSEIYLDFVGTVDEIVFYSINGRRMVLDREIILSYKTLEADASNVSFVEKDVDVTLVSVSNQIICQAPLCATYFTLVGDRFLREWGAQVEISSQTVEPYAVSSVTSASQQSADYDNQVNSGTSGALGGSAPCVVDFEAAVTDAAIFREWQFSRYSDFDVIDMRVSDLTTTYTFTEEGNTYVRFVCDNASGSCEHIGESYVISIGTSSLRCPNAFSPNGDGVNDEWKVSFTSIIEFECHIFDRLGRKMVSFTEPSQGWDGKYNGKTVPTGVYYYVIKAKGADGVKYDMSGDINIVKYE